VGKGVRGEEEMEMRNGKMVKKWQTGSPLHAKVKI
jgi:hypothetical protein